ncbi:MAG: cupredoxin domain-containing protein [Nanoarchaeota archaeon]
MKNALWIVLVGIVIVLAGTIIFMSSGSSSVTGNVVANTGDAQKITLSERDLNYYPSSITVKAGQLVELSLDSSVKGCLRSFTIRDLGVQQYAKTVSDTITFTPTKKGTFTFACSMGMGFGTINVE